MNRSFEITKSKMIEALKRSGYLLESEVAKMLFNRGFFIETNQIIIDPLTKKSREIDILAEYYNFKDFRNSFNTVCKVKFVMEIKNNLFPIVLLTDFKFSPNLDVLDGIKEIMTIPHTFNKQFDLFDGFYEKLIENNSEENIFTQYCSFQKKKGNNQELMALHPDNIHLGLSKITQYCEEQVIFWDNFIEENYTEYKKDMFFRYFLYLPVLLINDNLFEFHNDELKEVNSSILIYNYHFKEKPKMGYVFVVTKKGFPELINKILKIEKEIEKEMIEIKKTFDFNK